MKKFNKLLISLFVLSLAMGTDCRKKEEAKTPELVGKITFKRGKVKVNSKKGKIGDLIKKDDVVKTGKKSMVVVQFGSGALITLKSKSVFSVDKLGMKNDKPFIELLQKKGFSFNKVKKGFGGYNVKSTTSVAGVRGTAFSLVVAKNGATSIKLIEGSVAAAPIAESGKAIKDKEIIVEKNQKVQVSKKGIGKVTKLSKKEKKKLKQLKKIHYVKIEDKKPSESVVPEEPKELIIPPKAQKILVPGIKVKKKNMTEAELIAKYGSLTNVITKSGKVYKGVFKQKGSYMEIITTNGKVKIPANEVKKVEPLGK